MTRWSCFSLVAVGVAATGCPNAEPTAETPPGCIASMTATIRIVDPETEAGTCGVVLAVDAGDAAPPVSYACSTTLALDCECTHSSAISVARVLAHDVTTNELLYDGIPLYDESCQHAIVVQPRTQ